MSQRRKPDKSQGETDASDSVPPAAGAGREASTTVSSPNPYYFDNLVKIYDADSTDLSFLADQSVQLVVTSPPYNLGKDYGTARDDATYFGYLDWVRIWSRELYRVLEPGGRLC